MSNKNKQLTLLEKFQEGWEIRSVFTKKKAIQVVRHITDESLYFIEWEGGGASGVYNEKDARFTFTPPKERKTLYLYEDAEFGICTRVEPVTGDRLISVIHLEKNGDKWEVVNP